MQDHDESYDPNRDGEKLQTWSTNELVQKMRIIDLGYQLDPCWHVINMDATKRKDELVFIKDSMNIAI